MSQKYPITEIRRPLLARMQKKQLRAKFGLPRPQICRGCGLRTRQVWVTKGKSRLCLSCGHIKQHQSNLVQL